MLVAGKTILTLIVVLLMTPVYLLLLVMELLERIQKRVSRKQRWLQEMEQEKRRIQEQRYANNVVQETTA